ncbi:MAG: tetratricopeptide repeat protein [Nitrosomonadaceae bacterium]
MNFKLLGSLLPFCLAACAQIPGKAVVEVDKLEEQSEVGQLELPKQDLTAPMLFDFLLGETALQRGDSEIATESYLRLAKTTRDPRVAQRATEVALLSHKPVMAMAAATIWVELDPNSVVAHQTIAALLVSAGKLDEARPHLDKLLAVEGDVSKFFMQLNNLLVRNVDKAETLELVQQFAEPYPELPEAHFAVSQAAWLANQFDIAQQRMKIVLTLRPDWEMAAIHNGRILRRISSASAIEFYESYLETYPKANKTRITFARMLVAEKNYIKARSQFQQLLTENPENANVVLAVGLLSMELQDFDAAEENFKKTLELGYKDLNTIRFYLARIYEKTQRIDMAMEWYRSVTRGNQFLSAQIRYAFLLSKQGKLSEARKHLQQLPVKNDQQRAHLIVTEAELLREAGAHQEVFYLLSNGLEKLPDYPELLYDRAMAAEKIGKLDVLERDLRKLIQLKPDHAHAHNALGYSFAEHSNRLPEALELIEKAIKLSPEDPYIIDSLGWVYYRMGNLNKGVSYLKQAFVIKRDPEIAAHLGEVLWMQGTKEEAKEVWRSTIKSHPGNEVLLNTMKKFMP